MENQTTTFGRRLVREKCLNAAALEKRNESQLKGVGAHQERMEFNTASDAKKNRKSSMMDLLNPLPPCFDDNNSLAPISSSTSGTPSKARKKHGMKQIFRKSETADVEKNTTKSKNCENRRKTGHKNQCDSVTIDAEVRIVPQHASNNRNQNYQSVNVNEKSSRHRKDLRTGFTYQGLFNDQGLPDDKDGVMIWKNGDSYQGNFWNGMRDGMGTMSYADGSEYVGKWECDKMHGDGTRRFANGNVYFGPYFRGKRKGKNGQFLFLNGDVYTGDFDNDQFEGKGTYKHKSGITFDGSFINSKRQGLGICKRLDNCTDTSWYENDKPVGKGVRCNMNQDTAWKLYNGHVGSIISFEEAFQILGELEERERFRTQYR